MNTLKVYFSYSHSHSHKDKNQSFFILTKKSNSFYKKNKISHRDKNQISNLKPLKKKINLSHLTKTSFFKLFWDIVMINLESIHTNPHCVCPLKSWIKLIPGWWPTHPVDIVKLWTNCRLTCWVWSDRR